MARRGNGVHGTVLKIDGKMATFNRTLRKFGVPKGAQTELKRLKRSVGDVVATLEMIERRS